MKAILKPHNEIEFQPENRYDAFILGRATANLSMKKGQWSSSERVIGYFPFNANDLIEFIANINERRAS